MNSDTPISTALDLPSGAAFYKCALQVNPYEYVRRHRKPTSFSDETEYNDAIVAACRANKIDAIAVADHFRIEQSVSLMEACRIAGISVFPGIEAKTKDGVHLLCIFDCDTAVSEIIGFIGHCGGRPQADDSPTGRFDVLDFSSASKDWNALCVAAHVTGDGGLLRQLKGMPRIQAWRSPELLACAIPGSPEGESDTDESILRNKCVEYRREYPMAIINAADVSAPETLGKASASCLVKMSNPCLEGLRQAFLDPESRIRLNSDKTYPEHARMRAIAWEGGFLDQMQIHFNSDLNVLVGGRGAGKSTVIESLRYVLEQEPKGKEVLRTHQGIIKLVLREGTKVSLRVRSTRPSAREYTIERTVPNHGIVLDSLGKLTDLRPRDVLPGVEVLGQHEIGELTADSERLTDLLARFSKPDPAFESRRDIILRGLKQTRETILRTRADQERIDERLQTLAALEEQSARFRDAGIEERLQESSMLVREEQLLDSVPDRVSVLREALDVLKGEVPLDLTFLSAKALGDLPGRDIIGDLRPVLQRLSDTLSSGVSTMLGAFGNAEQEVDKIRSRWKERKSVVEADYQQTLRGLGTAAVDGADFIRVRRQIETLKPLRDERRRADAVEHEQAGKRRTLLIEWEDLKAEALRRLVNAGKEVSRQLPRRVRVEVAPTRDRTRLLEVLRRHVRGNLKSVAEALDRQESLSVAEFVERCRSGAEAVQERYGVTSAQAQRLASAPDEALMLIEELEFPPATSILLNTASRDAPPIWRALDDLSKGQKATAILLLLLLEAQGPLIVDQPEDDLDNRFISEEIVDRLREAKRKRQFVLSTHNANIPVLGDAELILGLTPTGEAGGTGQARICQEHMGAIDEQTVRDVVEELLEGGRRAFERRRRKYGF